MFVPNFCPRKDKQMKISAIEDLKVRLKAILVKSIADSIKELKQSLPVSSPKQSTLLLIEGRVNEINLNRVRGLISEDQLDVKYNQIRADLLEFIISLQESDFSPQAALKPNKNGILLYKMPKRMQLMKEIKCIIRLAFEEKDIIKNIDLDEHVQIKSVRISQIMNVGLLDPSDDENFSIRSYNDEEQFVERDDYTEWIYYIRPLKSGTLPLLLKVSVVEEINGKERLRNLIFEENINVVVEEAEETEEDFKPAYYINSQTESVRAAVSEKSTGSFAVGKRLMGIAVLFLFLGSAIFAIPSLIQELNWSNALEINTTEAFQEYLNEYPDGKYAPEAAIRINSDKEETESETPEEEASFRSVESKVKEDNVEQEVSKAPEKPLEKKVEKIEPQKEQAEREVPRTVKNKDENREENIVKLEKSASDKTIKEEAGELLNEENIPSENKKYGWLVDSRDGKKYTVVRLGKRVWMAENLDFKMPQSWEGSQTGRIYTYAAAMVACPKGWHLPSDAEWKELALSMGGYTEKGFNKNKPERAFPAFISILNSGKDNFFSGMRSPEGQMLNQGSIAAFWTASVSSKGAAYNYFLSKESRKIHRDNNALRTSGFSCRCVKDAG